MMSQQHSIQITNKFALHEYNITCITLLHNGKYASCSEDKAIKIFSIKYNNSNESSIPFPHIELEYLNAHELCITWITELTNSTNTLVTCSFDSFIKFWKVNANSIELIHSIKTETTGNTKVISLTNNRIAVSSSNWTITIFNSVSPYDKLALLKQHNDVVNSIIQVKDKETLISVSEDNTLIVWDLITYQMLLIFDEIYSSSPASLIELYGKYIVIGGRGWISLLEVDSYVLLNYIENEEQPNTTYMSFIEGDVNNNTFICGTTNGELNEVDINTNEITNSIALDNGTINTLTKLNNNSMFMAGTSFGFVIFYNYK
jgi:WD40 repeat protein